MKIIDLSHTIEEDMPVYPGTEQPKLKEGSTHEKDGFKETKLEMYSHVGTHMDAPQHIFESGISLDNMDAESFVGSALVIDASDATDGGEIGMSYLEKYKGLYEKAEFLIFYTGWDRYWNTDKYFENYPTISREVAEYAVESAKKGLGFDTIGIDSISDEHLRLHHIILKSNRMVIIENLCNVESLIGNVFKFAALPLKYKDADGAPVRAIAIIE